jgi:hypothetical protein
MAKTPESRRLVWTLAGSAAGDDRPVVHQGKHVRVARREVEVVQDREHRNAARRGSLRRVEQGELMRQVEIGDRLIEQKRLAIMDGSSGLNLRQDAGELDAPLLPAREGRVGSRREREHIRHVEAALDDACARLRVDATDPIEAKTHDLMSPEGR